MVYKKTCFACANTTENSPNKIFVRVPLDARRRKLWFEAVNFNKKYFPHHLHACEDHFELTNDAENWVYYKTIGKFLRLKKNAIPHKNIGIFGIDNEQQAPETQLSESARKLKAQNIARMQSKKKVTTRKENRLQSKEFMIIPLSPPQTVPPIAQISNAQKAITSAIPNLTIIAQEPYSYTNTIIKKLNIPFQNGFKSDISIVDCLEIEIEKSIDPVVETLTWSKCKNCNTLKFLISLTPSGVINFISGAYGGKTSNKDIFVHCGFLDVLPEGGKIMADRGLKPVAGLLADIGRELIFPATESESKGNSINALRVHVERIVRQMRCSA